MFGGPLVQNRRITSKQIRERRPKHMALDTDLLLDDPYKLPEVGIPSITPGQNLLLDWILSQVYASQAHVDCFRKQYEQCRRFFDGKQLTDEDKKSLEVAG